MKILKTTAKKTKIASTDFDGIYAAFFKEIRNFIKSRTQREMVAQDLAQDVFLKYWRACFKTKIENPRAFLYMSAKNIIIDYRRSQSLKPSHMVEIMDVIEVLPNDEAPIETQIISRQSLRTVVTTVNSMSPLRNEIFERHFFKGEKQGDVAATLGVCRSTVEKNIQQARKELAFCI